MNLENYRVELKNGRKGIPLHQLLEPHVMKPVLLNYANRIGTDSLAAAGSLFMKRYAVLVAASAFDYYGLQRKTEDWWTTAEFEPETFTLLVERSQGTELPGDWKSHVFADHLTPMIEEYSKEWKTPQKILWENIAVRLQSVLRKKSSVFPSHELEQLFKELTLPETRWIGRKDNPFSIYLQQVEEWGIIPIRKTCCRYYQVKGEEENPYCGNCPLPQKMNQS